MYLSSRISRYTVEHFWEPKSTSSPRQYEDAFSVGEGRDGDLWCSIADGATESIHSKLWAKLLCECFLLAGNLDLSFSNARKRWSETVDRSGTKLKWYEEASLAQGAHAAFMACRLSLEGELSVKVIGDCCLSILDNSGIVKSWPNTELSQFNNTPELISSLVSSNEVEPRYSTMQVEPNESILLATDAVAKYLMTPGMVSLGDCESAKEFFECIINERGKSIPDDDLTMILITGNDESE